MTNDELKQHVLHHANLPGGFLPGGLLYLALTGSRAYGIHREDSDYDLVGVVAPPPDYIIGTLQWESVHRQTDIADIKLYSPRKFVSMMAQGSMNNVELLYLPHIHMDPTLKMYLFPLRNHYITRSTLNSIRGYVVSTLSRFRNTQDSDLGSKRRTLIETFGYDCSAAVHCFRWLWLGGTLLTRGIYAGNNLLDSEKDFLKEVKNGRLSAETVEAAIIRTNTIFEDVISEHVDAIKTLDPRIPNVALMSIHKELLTRWDICLSKNLPTRVA